MKKIAYFTAILTVFVLGVGFTVQAAKSAQNPGQIINTLTANATSTRATSTSERQLRKCENFQEKFGLIIDRHDNNKEKYLNLFINLQNRLSRIVQRLEAQGIDVSDLKADLVVLNQKITKFQTDYAAYQAKIQEINNLSCSDTGLNNPIKNDLKSSRTLLKNLQKDILDVRTYYQTVIRKDLQALKSQVDNLKKPSITGNENSAGNRATSTATSTDED
ncbi:MAG: hypothetical protein AAB358_01685 [Patescibacteria group bacterium]